jgi:hypothetical protein
MLNFSKSLWTVGIALFFFSLFTAVQAQALPSVYIKNLTLESGSGAPEFRVGEKISGNFKIINDSSELLTNLFYEVKLVGDFQTGGIVDGIPRLNYDAKSFGPLSLFPGESKDVNFEYELPKFVSADDLGIEVQARLSSGQWLGWDNKKIKIIGESKMLETSGSFIESGGAKFTMNNGPTLRVGEKATLNMILTNKMNILSPITPKITFYKQSVDTLPISEIKLSDIALPNGKSANFIYDLPRFDSEAGTYIGSLVFVDKNNEQVYPDIIFRYILPGESFVFQNISVDRGAVRKGDNIKVDVTFSGQPDDIQMAETVTAGDSKQYDLELSIFSSGELVANHMEKISGADLQTISFELKAKKTASELQVIAKISDGGKILAEYKTSLPETAIGERTVKNYQYLIIIVLMIIIVILSLRKIKSTTVFVLLFLAANLVWGVNFVSAASVTVSRSAPGNYSAYNINDQFDLKVAVTGKSCSNEHQRLKIFTAFVADSASCPANTSSYTEQGSIKSYNSGGGNDIISKVGNFSISLNAPSAAGKYKLCYRAKVYEYGVGDDNGNSVDGVSNVNDSASVTDSLIISVAPPPTNLNLSCENGVVTSTWTAPSGYNTFYFRAHPGKDVFTATPSFSNDNVGSASYTFSGTIGTTYHVWVHTKATDGAWSAAIDGNVTCKLPKPTNLVLTCPSPGTTVNATWTAPAGYNKFNLRANPMADDWTWPSQVRTDSITGTSSSFVSQVDKTYHVWVETSSGSLWSDPVHANVTCVRPTATCSVSPTFFATIGQTVTWTATSTGLTAPVTYSWQGNEFANGQIQASFSGSYSSETPETKHATATVSSSGVSIAVPCPGTVIDGGSGPDTCSGACGAGIGVTEPTVNGSCPTGLTFLSEPSLSGLSCLNGTKSGPVTGGANGPWGWTCLGTGPSATNDNCSAAKRDIFDPNLTCTLTRTLPTTTNILVNKKNAWTVAPVVPCSNCFQAKWSVEDMEYNTGLILDTHIFTTSGTKTVSAALASSTEGVYGPVCSATSTVAQEGGRTDEL